MLMAWGVAWIALLLWAVPDVPVDNAEQLTWVRSLQWGYYKHPPLPTWLIAPFVHAVGLHAWVAAALGGAIKVGALALWWDLLRRLFDARRASIGLVLVCGVAYYSSRLHLYSHNEVMLACSVVSAWALWKAWQDGGIRHWLLLGLFLGLGLLAKYQAVTTVVSVLVFCVCSGAGFNAARRRGLWAALAVMVLVVAPHAIWLASHPHTPLGYAAESSLWADWSASERFRQALAWIGDLVVRSAGALLLWALLQWQARRLPASLDHQPAWRGLNHQPAWRGLNHQPAWRGLNHQPDGSSPSACSVHQGDARRLVWSWALVPLIVVLAMGLLGGATIRPHWATPIALWIVAALVATLPGGVIRSVNLKPMLAVGAVVQLLLVGQLVWSVHLGPPAAARWGQPMTHRWAPAVAEAARRELDGDIRVVIAPETVATGLALVVPERPYAVVDGRLEISPWVPAGLMERCGVLFVVYEPPGSGKRPVEGGPPGLIWRVVPPSDGRGCRGDDKRL